MLTGVLVLAALGGLSVPVQSHQRAFESDTLFCAKNFRDETGGRVTATIEVDRDYVVVGSTVSYRNRDFSAEWSVTDGALDKSAKLLRFEAFAELAVGTGFPVDGRFVLDGYTVWHLSFAGPSGYLIDPARMPAVAEDEAQCLVSRCLVPRIVVRLNDDDRIDLFDAGRGEIFAEKDGHILARKAVVLPDWKATKRFVWKAMTELDQQVARRECEPIRSVLES